MADTRIMRCGHCQKQGDFEIRGEGTLHGAVLDDNYHDGQNITKWRILECKQCKKPTLEEIKTSYLFVTDDVYGWQEPISSEITILYPAAHESLKPLPK